MKMVHEQICYAKAVWHTQCLHTHVLPFLSFLDCYFYPEAGHQNSHFSTTTYWWCDQLDCGTFQSPLVEKILLDSWILCLQAECCWWSQRRWSGALCVLQESTLWASVRAHSDTNPWDAAKQPGVCEESLPGRCGWCSVTSVTKIWYNHIFFLKFVFQFLHLLPIAVLFLCFDCMLYVSVLKNISPPPFWRSKWIWYISTCQILHLKTTFLILRLSSSNWTKMHLCHWKQIHFH